MFSLSSEFNVFSGAPIAYKGIQLKTNLVKSIGNRREGYQAAMYKPLVTNNLWTEEH